MDAPGDPRPLMERDRAALLGLLRDLAPADWLRPTAAAPWLAFWWEQDLDELGESVSWAGPDPAPARLDCAREVTEYWIHQQQVREAVGRPVDTDPATVHAVLDTFLHAVPLTLRDEPGTALRIETEVGAWAWERGDAGWTRVASTPSGDVLRVDSATLWRLCVRMVEPDEARNRSVVDGAVADAVLQIVSIIR